jgi:hypothetical protein
MLKPWIEQEVVTVKHKNPIKGFVRRVWPRLTVVSVPFPAGTLQTALL